MQCCVFVWTPRSEHWTSGSRGYWCTEASIWYLGKHCQCGQSYGQHRCTWLHTGGFHVTTITIEPKQKGRTYISKVKLSVKWVLCLFNINTLQNLNKIATTIFMKCRLNNVTFCSYIIMQTITMYCTSVNSFTTFIVLSFCSVVLKINFYDRS